MKNHGIRKIIRRIRKYRKKQLIKRKTFVGVVLDAKTGRNRFVAMQQILDIAYKKLIDPNRKVSANEFSAAEKGAVCLLPDSSSRALSQAEDCKLIYSKDPEGKAITASTVKVMSLITGLDYVDSIEDYVTIEASDLQKGSGNYFLEGDRITIREMIFSMLLPSSNTCAIAFARICGEKMIKKEDETRSPSTDECLEKFVSQMNDKAKKIGMADTSFVSPSGLTKENISTASDLIKMTVEACSYDAICKIWDKKEHNINVKGPNHRTVQLKSTLIDESLEKGWQIIGGKTGILGKGKNAAALVVVAKKR